MEAWELALALSGSFVAGYVGSMLGLVLGTLRLPLIVAVAGSPLAAAGTNIAISAASAGAGALRHAREGRVDWRVVAWMAPPSIAGAVARRRLRRRRLGAAALRGDRGRARLERDRSRPAAGARAGPGAAAAARPRCSPGFGIGVLGGAVGVILGTLRMPALVRGVGLGVKRAAGTNLVVGFLLGVAGFAAHAGALGVDWATLAAGLAGALPGRLARREGDGPLRRAGAAARPRRRPRASSAAPSRRRRRSSVSASRRRLAIAFASCLGGRVARERQHGAGPDGERPRCGLARDRDQAQRREDRPQVGRRTRARRRRRRRRRRRCCAPVDAVSANV